uniref:Uncharacterized protein n=1 Tax=Attheya septentrionalis TaxID=420275 RepID=A0A7S2UCI2_9STRA|mmetsp:Transcript_17976/g.32588  ORF Transcript_17976/g.32588 Transcript_17976/m.32588 type:complete len:498 (+) Transcript_17976:174-1667(+)
MTPPVSRTRQGCLGNGSKSSAMRRLTILVMGAAHIHVSGNSNGNGMALAFMGPSLAHRHNLASRLSSTGRTSNNRLHSTYCFDAHRRRPVLRLKDIQNPDAVEKSNWEKVAASLVDKYEGVGPASQSVNSINSSTSTARELEIFRDHMNRVSTLTTVLRTGIPATLAGVIACQIHPPLSMAIADLINDPRAFSVISQDSSQYIQNICTVCGLTFSLLVGQTYYFMYQQQEAIYLALFHEVTVAKSLLEQVALVSQGRDVMYRNLLGYVMDYVQYDLKRSKATDPAVLLSARPVDDPLESIMYITSVGEPSVVYDTVRSLRQARAQRLGALQPKLPQIHMILLWSLAGAVLSTFPLLGAGSQTIGGQGILHVQGTYLGFIVFGIFISLSVVDELRKPGGGAYNTDTVLNIMVSGLEEELESRISGRYNANSNLENASPTIDSDYQSNPVSMTLPPQDEMKEEIFNIEEVPITVAIASPTKKASVGRRIFNRMTFRQQK